MRFTGRCSDRRTGFAQWVRPDPRENGSVLDKRLVPTWSSRAKRVAAVSPTATVTADLFSGIGEYRIGLGRRSVTNGHLFNIAEGRTMNLLGKRLIGTRIPLHQPIIMGATESCPCRGELSLDSSRAKGALGSILWARMAHLGRSQEDRRHVLAYWGRSS